ncbi:hypothetical protein SAMN06265222_106206 [Neorhodopirellula lusitana]|uniref:histidine kinase n=1 Tax=Neorhodopirellula lusitana TaxID=445327 RepID=A0ABY1Q4B3_9BACT|nr:HAMP domain-containing sensor histidine kinase [Neorhodopirellula lusitana]SMP59297.1 hypothetical protein SAMN06265222_106206 [Neorhodopirellula lusitana]
MPLTPHYRSLRFRLLGPIVATALFAAVIVAIASYALGDRWAAEERDNRVAAMRRTLTEANFPLNAIVLKSLAELTQTELVTLSRGGSVLNRTLTVPVNDLSSDTVVVDKDRYDVVRFQVDGGRLRSDRVDQVAVLFDQRQLAADRRRAAWLPLVTGFSTIFALSSMILWLTSWLVRRISRLQKRVEAVAAGDFQSGRSLAPVTEEPVDEIGRLGVAVDEMSGQLDQLWKQVNRQQSQKLLHQIAGGMAHQLRNSLTGARMAVELHAQVCPAMHADRSSGGDAKGGIGNGEDDSPTQNTNDDDTLEVAISQIEQAEDYVRRLLLAASGREAPRQPAEIVACWNEVRTNLASIAQHWNVKLDWDWDDSIGTQTIADGPTWVAAITNLVHNAMQAGGDEVIVRAKQREDGSIGFEVRDNGPGLDEKVQADLFEPFVTSKPEGLGLGLSVVQRAAEVLGGKVDWARCDGWTVFEFSIFN